MSRRGLFAALEDLEEASVIDGDTPYGEEVDKADLDARDAQKELEEHSEAIDNLLDDAGEATEDTETLQEIGGAIGAAADAEVGIDDVSIAPTIIATEAIFRNLGMENYKLMPSLESFASSNSRVAATRRAQVTIENAVTDIIDKIWAAIKAAWEQVRSWFMKLVTSLMGRLDKYKDEVAKTVKAIPNDAKGKDFESSSLYKAFGTPSGGKVTLSDVKEVLDSHVKLNDVLTKMSGGNLSAFMDKLVRDKKDEKEIEKAANEAIGDTFKGKLDNMRLVNGTHIISGKDNDWGRPEFKSDWSGKDAPEKAELECGNKSELTSLLTQIGTMIKDIKNGKEKFDALDKQIKKAEKEVIESANKSDDEKTHATAVSRECSKFVRVYIEMFKKISGLNNVAVKSGLDYVNTCAKNLRSDKK